MTAANLPAHTPAPWELRSEGWEGQFIYAMDGRVPNGDKRFIAEVSAFYDGAEANARLIAAAPDLLEALIACSTADGNEAYSSACHLARAAIAKATWVAA